MPASARKSANSVSTSSKLSRGHSRYVDPWIYHAAEPNAAALDFSHSQASTRHIGSRGDSCSGKSISQTPHRESHSNNSMSHASRMRQTRLANPLLDKAAYSSPPPSNSTSSKPCSLSSSRSKSTTAKSLKASSANRTASTRMSTRTHNEVATQLHKDIDASLTAPSHLEALRNLAVLAKSKGAPLHRIDDGHKKAASSGTNNKDTTLMNVNNGAVINVNVQVVYKDSK